MNIESKIKESIAVKLEDGTIEKLVQEQLVESVNKALNGLFGPYGDVTKLLEKEMKSVMIPYLERYDYSSYILKLDSVLTDVVSNCTTDNRKILTNFKNLVAEYENDEMEICEIFSKYKSYVAEHVDTDNLDISYEEGVNYENVEVSYEMEVEDSREWSYFEYGTLVFTCDQDKEMNTEVKISRYKQNSNWELRYDAVPDISSLRHLNDFEVFLLNLTHSKTKIYIKDDSGCDEVRPEKEPEATYV